MAGNDALARNGNGARNGSARLQAPIRVMLVDDHRTVLWGLEKLVNGERPRMEAVGCAASGTEAIDLAAKLRPDVILLDIDLGEDNGVEAIPDLLACSNAKILIVTGLRDQAVHDAAVLAGARGVIQKECAAELILKAIECVHGGELWLDRAATSRIVARLSRPGAAAPTPQEQELAQLTGREREVVDVVANHAGASTKAIADLLHISEHTVRNHLTSIYGKLGVLNRLELFVYASKFAGKEAPAARAGVDVGRRYANGN